MNHSNCKVAIFLSQKENVKILTGFLKKFYSVFTVGDIEEIDQVDLLIADGLTLKTHFLAIEKKKKEAGIIFFPVLLVSNVKDAGLSTSNIWQIADEIINTPVVKIELLTRVKVLLKTRELSLDQQFQYVGVLKQENEKLAESELKFKNLFENHTAVKLIVDPQTGQIFSANHAAAKFYGWTVAEIERMNIGEINLLPKEENKNLLGQAQKNAKNHFEFKHRHADGSVSDVAVFSSAVSINGKEFLHSIIYDISDRKKAESRVRLLNKSVEQSPASIVITNKKGIIEYVNPFFSEVTGYSFEEAVGKNPRILNSGTHDKSFFRDLWETINSGKTWRGELCNVKKNGELYWENAIIAPIFEDGQITHFVGVKEDITEKKRILQELTTAKEKAERNEIELKKAQEITHIGSWYLDVATNEVVWTEELFKMYGFDRTKPVPPYTEHMKLFTPESWEILSASLAKTAETGIPYELELNTVKKDGSNGWMWVRGEAVKDENNNITGLWGAAQDITARKNIEIELLKAKEKVEKSEEKFRKAILANPDAISINRLADGVYLEVNEGFLNTFKYQQNDIKGKSSFEINIWHNVNQRDAYKSLLETNKKLESFEAKFVAKTGEVIDCLVSASVIVLDGEPCTINITKDIRNLKEIENKLVAAKVKAEESDRLKSAFLANMSHEIRTPMNGILGFTNLLLEPDLSSEVKESYIQIVQKSGERMLNTVNDIIEISKIEAGLVQLNTAPVHFNSRVNELYQFFLPEATKKGIQLVLNSLLPHTSATFETDKNKLDSILTNLIKNAIKYTNSGTIELGCKQKHQYVEFYVKDTGIGIPSNRIDAIFNRFEQADIEDTRAFQGSGLGLAIVKSYVKMLGGEIGVESEVGKGSIFWFTLPLKNKPGENQLDNNKISPDGESVRNQIRGLKILIVEDDEPSGNFLSILVNGFSREILKTDNGAKTVELCRDNQDIDLILMDIQLPGMSGYESTLRIREFNKKVIIIAQTAYALSGDKEKAIEAGCNDYISKPVKKVELQKLIEKYFG